MPSSTRSPERAPLSLKCAFEPALERALRRRADLGVGDLAIFEEDHRRDAAHAIFARRVGIFIDVDLGDHDLAGQFIRNLFERRADHLARAAPFGPEIRSEEHTSELQSLMRISYAVFCLKKKNNST